MSKKKGFSIDEKAVKVEEYLAANPHPHTLKELVALLPKATGVIPQSVEEVLELLLSEGRISSEKIGVSVFFWKFAPTADKGAKEAPTRGRRVPLESIRDPQILAERLAAARAMSMKLASDIAARAAVAGSAEERLALNEGIARLTAEVKERQRRLRAVAAFDPSILSQLSSATQVAFEAANRWTDNLFILEQFCSSRLKISTREFRKRFGLPHNLDFFGYDTEDDVSDDAPAEEPLADRKRSAPR